MPYVSQARVTALEAFADNVHALSSSEDQTIRLWDFVAEKCLTCFSTKQGAIHGIALVPDQVRWPLGVAKWPDSVPSFVLNELVHRKSVDSTCQFDAYKRNMN